MYSFFVCYAAHLHLHSFPTRRSSDLFRIRLASAAVLSWHWGGGRGAGPVAVLCRGDAALRQARSGSASQFRSPDCRTHNRSRSEEHTSELQSRVDLVCRLLLEKKKKC